MHTCDQSLGHSNTANCLGRIFVDPSCVVDQACCGYACTSALRHYACSTEQAKLTYRFVHCCLQVLDSFWRINVIDIEATVKAVVHQVLTNFQKHLITRNSAHVLACPMQQRGSGNIAYATVCYLPTSCAVSASCFPLFRVVNGR